MFVWFLAGATRVSFSRKKKTKKKVGKKQSTRLPVEVPSLTRFCRGRCDRGIVQRFISGLCEILWSSSSFVLFCFGFALVRNLLQRVLTLLVFSSSGMEADQEQEAQQQQQEKWTGGVELTLSCPVESAWAVQSDFLGLHKWAPNILLCELVEGENKKVGCLRHCVGTGTTWVHERLLQFDDDNMYMSYRMEQNHFIFPKGFQGYHSTVQVHNSCSPHPPPPPFFILDLQFLRFFSFLQTSKSLQLFANFQVSSAFSNFPIFFSFLQLPSFFSFLQLSSFFSFLKLMSSSFSSNFFSSSSLFLFVLLLISRSRTKLASKCGTKFTLQLEVCNYTKLLCIIIHDWIGIRESPFLFSGCKWGSERN